MNNPFQAPETDSHVIGVVSGTKEDLRKVAQYQRMIMLCILSYFAVGLGGQGLVAATGEPIISLVVLLLVFVVLISGCVLVIMLSTKVFEQLWVGILFGILSLIPCVGLIFLLIVNGKATSVLRKNNIRVGLLGANPNHVR